jgi:hypothetical protein
MFSPRRITPVAAAMTLALSAVHADAASVRLIRGLLDPAAGGGVFAGSGFVGTPAAAGTGYVAFRSLVANGSTSEQIIRARMTFGARETIAIASIGKNAPTGLGTYTSFIGNPAVNASGDVAFVATLTDADDLPDDPDLPAPAALFVYEAATETITARVLARENSPAGPVAFVESFDASGEVVETTRTPALNDAGDIAFTAATRVDPDTEGGAVFWLPAIGGLQVVSKTGDALTGSTFTGYGPPAVNTAGAIAFRGRLEGIGPIDGIFRWKNGVFSTIARNGDMVTTTEPVTRDQTVTRFGDAVAIDDADAVALLATPMFDYTFVEPGVVPDPDEAGFGLLLGSGSGLQTLAYPGQAFEDRGRITDVRLQSEFSADPPGASFASDGSVAAYVTLNGGSSDVLARIASAGAAPTTLIAFGGTLPSPSPLGGTFLAAAAAPVADDAGGVAVFARLAAGPASDALVYDPATGSSTFVAAGDTAPGEITGVLAGPAFSNPAINDQGEVVFRAFVAGGPAGLGLYRWSGNQIAPLVRVGDAAPVTGNPPFVNIVGEHDLNDGGTVAFAAVAGDLGRGMYTVGATGIARVAVVGDAGPAGLGTNPTFVSVVGNPSISDDGTVAFRGRVQFTDGGTTRRREGIFVRAGSQVRALVVVDDPSPESLPFFRFRDLSLREGVRVAFTASLGENDDEQEGLFVGDLTSLGTVAIVGESLGGGLQGLTGRPNIDRDGAVTMLGQVASGSGTHAALVRGNTAFFEPVVEIGDEGPAGGTFRSMGRPAVSASGRSAFRATFEPNTGGVGGFFLESSGTLTPFVSVGDAAPTQVGGRFTSFNQRAALNSNDTLAFIASLTGSDVDNGLFLASPSSFAVKKVGIKLGTSTKADKMQLTADLEPGGLSEGLDPATARLDLTVTDDGSAVWTQTVPVGGLVKKAGKYVFKSPPDVGLISIKVNRRTQRVKLKVKAQPDFSGGGVFPFEPPVRVRMELGDVSGQASLGCLVKGKKVTCK